MHNQQPMEATLLNFKRPSETGISISLETITPMRAEELLRRNENNRNVRLSKINEYRRAMIEGRWRENGETIKVSSSGRLLDGQHRLRGVVAAGVPVKMLVAYNVEDDTFDTIDIGMARTGADILSIKKLEYAAVCAAAVAIVRSIQLNIQPSNARVAPDEILDWVQENPTIVDSAKATLASAKIMPHGTAAGVHFVLAGFAKDDADQFFHDLATGAGLEAGDGVLLLRDRLRANKSQPKAKLQRMEIIAITIRAWNARRRGERIKILKGTIVTGENRVSLPEII